MGRVPDPDLTDAITQNATGPAEAQGDSGRVKQHGLQDQIAADRYLASKAAARSPGLGLTIRQIVPPGAAE